MPELLEAPVVAARTKRPVVAIVYRAAFRYRIPFYEALRKRLDALGIELRLIYGEPAPSERKKNDTGDVSWGTRVHNRWLGLGRVELCWQPCLGLVRDADLVIVEQANKHLVNLPLLLGRLWGRRRVAFWGHGKDFQEEWKRVRWRDRLKRALATRVDWWFAYTDGVKSIVERLGFPPDRITSVANAIDTRELRDAKARVQPETLERLRKELGLTGRNVCIFAGGMYAEKRLAFLIDACRLARKNFPDLEVIFLGAGPDQAIVEVAACEEPWIRYVGPRFDRDKVPYFLLSKLLLMPGLVGLVVLDAFALEVPIITTEVPYHSPEIEYLEHGVNGWIARPAEDAAAYARAIETLLSDEPARARLAAGCRAAAERYTLEGMVERFASGVVGALTASD